MALDVDLAILARLKFVSRRRRRGGSWGERRSVRRGAGLEFADYRDYTPGDDPRRVDWNLYARLDRPYVRLFEEEEDLTVTVLVDGSLSMAWGEGAGARWPAVQQVAAGLGAVALLSGDTLRGALLRDGQIAELWGPGRGRGYWESWRRWSEALETGQAGGLATGLRDLAARSWRAGLALVLTDGYDSDGLAAGLSALAGRGYEPVLLHLLTQEELEPSLRGELRLVDVESGQRREVTIDGAALDAYQRRLNGWQSELRALAGRYGGRYALLPAHWPLRQLLLEVLRHAGIVR